MFMEKKTIDNQNLVTFYEYFGWTVEKIDSKKSNDYGDVLTYTLIRDLPAEKRALITKLEKEGEKIFKVEKRWGGKFNNYIINNIILTLSTLMIFFLVARGHNFFDTSELTFPFIRDLLLFTIADYLVLYLGFFALRIIINHNLKKKMNAILLEARSLLS